jgi:hypothetical protein
MPLWDHEPSSSREAIWTLLLVVVPWLGAGTYLIARGRSMNAWAMAESRREQALGQYIIQTATAAHREHRRRAREAGGAAGSGHHLSGGVPARHGGGTGPAARADRFDERRLARGPGTIWSRVMPCRRGATATGASERIPA